MSKRRIHMFTSGFKKTIGLFLLAFGIGVGISLILPFWGWVAICAIAVAIFGITWLFC